MKFEINYLILLSLIILLKSCSTNIETDKGKPTKNAFDVKDFSQVTNFNKYFEECKVGGSFLIYEDKDSTWITNDSVDIHRLTVPASTFKIINLLIALETEVIEDEKEIIKWPGKTDTIKYGIRRDIWRDMSVEEAFKLSAGWVFIELAKRIGRDKYQYYLNLCNYGNLDLSQAGIDFWNFGDFGISPINQIQILRAIHTEEIPFSKENIKILKRVMITEHNEEYVVRGKTGWAGRTIGMNIGWWVGYIESSSDVFFFATRLMQDRKFKTDDFGNCRKTITNSILRGLNKIPDKKVNK